MQSFFKKNGAKLLLGVAGTGLAGFAIHKGYYISQDGKTTLFNPPPQLKAQQDIEGITAKGSVHSENVGNNPQQKVKNVSSDGDVTFINQSSEAKQASASYKL